MTWTHPIFHRAGKAHPTQWSDCIGQHSSGRLLAKVGAVTPPLSMHSGFYALWQCYFYHVGDSLFSFSLNLGLPFDLLWPTECGRSDIRWVPRLREVLHLLDFLLLLEHCLLITIKGSLVWPLGRKGYIEVKGGSHSTAKNNCQTWK